MAENGFGEEAWQNLTEEETRHLFKHPHFRTPAFQRCASQALFKCPPWNSSLPSKYMSCITLDDAECTEKTREEVARQPCLSFSNATSGRFDCHQIPTLKKLFLTRGKR
jgi:hypothetical protein